MALEAACWLEEGHGHRGNKVDHLDHGTEISLPGTLGWPSRLSIQLQGSGRHLEVGEFKPRLGLSAVSVEPASDPPPPSLSAPPPVVCVCMCVCVCVCVSLSLSLKNK